MGDKLVKKFKMLQELIKNKDVMNRRINQDIIDVHGKSKLDAEEEKDPEKIRKMLESLSTQH